MKKINGTKKNDPKKGGKRLTTEDFINKARLKHGDRYDYSVSEYHNSKSKIQIRCPVHGIFEMTPSNHLLGHGCQKCAGHTVYTVIKGDYGVTAKARKCWKRIRERLSRKSYKDCIIDPEWDIFENFLLWYKNNYREGMDLDKDILSKGTKIYSPKTCCFVPRNINCMLSHASIENRGVTCNKSTHKFEVNVCVDGKTVRLGSFDSKEEALSVYKKEKEAEIKRRAEKAYKEGLISPNVYLALMHYEIM